MDIHGMIEVWVPVLPNGGRECNEDMPGEHVPQVPDGWIAGVRYWKPVPLLIDENPRSSTYGLPLQSAMKILIAPDDAAALPVRVADEDGSTEYAQACVRRAQAPPQQDDSAAGLPACLYRGTERKAPGACCTSWHCARYATLVTGARCKGCEPEAAFTGKLGVVIPARNEGVELHATVASILAAAVAPTTAYVLDDASGDHSCEALDAVVIRHKEPLGVALCRNEGTEQALADGCAAVLYQDGHMRTPYGTLETMAARAVENGSIVASASVGIEGKGFYGSGCRLQYFPEPPQPGKPDGVVAKWNTDREAAPWRECACIMGGCYAMSAETAIRLMQPTGRVWDNVDGIYGYSEESLCLKAHMLGIPIEAATHLPVAHLYRGTNPAADATQAIARNKVGVLTCLFGVERARRMVGTSTLAALSPGEREALEVDAAPAQWPEGVDVEAAVAALPIVNHPCAAPVPPPGHVAEAHATGLVSCLMATHGRYRQACVALACWMAQDYGPRELIVLNTHPQPIRCAVPGVRVYNEPGVQTLGEARTRLLALAAGEFVRTWDDDDLYLPWAARQGVERIGQAPAWKPARSWSTMDGLKTARLNANAYEASMTVRTDVARRYGYKHGQGDEHRPLLAGIAQEGGCAKDEVGADASYVYCWGTGLTHASSDLRSGDDIAARTARWKAAHQDTGGGAPLWPTPLRRTWLELGNAVKAGPDEDEHGKSLRTNIAKALRNPLELVGMGLDLRSSMGTQSMAVVLPALMDIGEAQTCIEVGLGRGFTAHLLAAALAAITRDGVLLSCDVKPDSVACATANAAPYPVRHKAMCRDSAGVDWRAELAAMGRKHACVAMVDGDHSYEGASADLRAVLDVVRPGGLVVCHDYWHVEQGVLRAVAEVMATGEWDRLVVAGSSPHHSYPWCVLQKRAPDQ